MTDKPANPATPATPAKKSRADDFASQADQQAPGLVREFLDFLLHNKKWWLIPILVVLLLVAILVVLGGGPLAPFIYTIF